MKRSIGGMIRNTLSSILVGGTLIWSTPVAAVENVSLGLRASTLGAGVELSVAMLDRLTLRIPVNGLRYSDDFEEGGIAYDGDLDLFSVGLLADFHVFGGAFHLTGGLFSNGNELNLRADEGTGNTVFPVGNARYRSDPEDPLTITAGLDFDSVAPYAGIGWGNAASGTSSLYVKFELGVLLQGSPAARAQASGSARDADAPENGSFQVNDATDPRAQRFREQLTAEARTLEGSLDDFDIYPVVSLSLGYRF